MNRLSRHFVAVAAISLILLGGMSAFADVVVYLQPPTLDGILFASQNDTGGGFGNYATVYDNFTIMAQVPYYLTDVHWWGGYFNPPQQGNITGWTISIYADAANAPGGLLWQQFFADNASEMFLGNFGGYPYFAYHEDDIVSNFWLMPGTQYWLSVVPDVAFPPQWGWGTGFMGDGLAYQDYFGTLSPLAYDMAFDVSGVTPEPGTMILLGTAILGLAGTLRRRFS